jgi:hypothetical protein
MPPLAGFTSRNAGKITQFEPGKAVTRGFDMGGPDAYIPGDSGHR